MGLENLIPGVSQAKLILGGVCAVAIFGAGVAADRVAPFVGANAAIASRDAKLAKASVALGAASEDLRVAALNLTAAGGAIATRDGLLRSNGKMETTNAQQTDSFWKHQAATAYDEGWAAHACVPGVPAVPGAPVGLRSNLGAAWDSGRYVPGQATPGSRTGGPHGGG